MSEPTSPPHAARLDAERAARSQARWNLAAAACGIVLAALLEVFIIARYEPRAHDTADASVDTGVAAAAPSGDEAATAASPSFDVRQRVLPDELPPRP